VKYEVLFTPTAQSQALAAAEYIALRSPRNAVKWYKGIERAIDSLSILPNRCGAAPESQFLGQQLRHYIYKSHRIIFRVEEETKIVRILYVRHGAMEPLGKPPDPDADPST
jgi:plasmid stabilization system protein ParE